MKTYVILTQYNSNKETVVLYAGDNERIALAKFNEFPTHHDHKIMQTWLNGDLFTEVYDPPIE
jgi:hypothetical protein